MTPKTPSNRRNLDMAIQRIYGEGEQYLNIRTIMANTIVAQMMPDGAVKGGTAIKFRFGNDATRFTSDFDTVYKSSLDEFISKYRANLVIGWNGFTGHIVSKDPARPKDVPREYVMQPFEIKLSYVGRSWLTVVLEVGHNEIGDADEPDWGVSPDVVEIFRQLGLSDPEPIALMALDHQVAQKLHGLSEPDSDRIHDLVDLQLISAQAEQDLVKLKYTCKKLFAYRNLQVWPPIISNESGWGESYFAQAEGLDVLQNVDEAVIWVNNLIEKICAAEEFDSPMRY